MGAAYEDFVWDVIGPNENVGVFIHPYGKRDFTSFCIVVDLHANEPSGSYSQIAAQLTEGPTYDFMGGVARTLWVKNETSGPQQPYISVKLMSFTQTA